MEGETKWERRVDNIACRDKGGEKCLALYCFDYLENIGFVYPTMSMIVIGHWLAPILRQSWCSLMFDVYGLA